MKDDAQFPTPTIPTRTFVAHKAKLRHRVGRRTTLWLRAPARLRQQTHEKRNAFRLTQFEIFYQANVRFLRHDVSRMGELSRLSRVLMLRRRIGVEKHVSQARTTTDHDEIRKWAEERGGRPSIVETDGEGGILRIDFQEPDENLKPISWDEFFRIFEDRNLAFLYQEEISGHKSRFNKLVDRSAVA